jgi:hypothetical protein
MALPEDGALVHCASCKLAFDPDPDRVPPPKRAPTAPEVELEVPPGITVARDAGGLTIRIVRDRLTGLVWLAAGAVMAGLQVGFAELDWSNAALFAIDAVLIYAGLAWLLGTRIVRVDARTVSTRLVPLPLLPRNAAFARAEIDEVELRTKGDRYFVVARLTNGEHSVLAALKTTDKTTRAAAIFVTRTLQVALTGYGT